MIVQPCFDAQIVRQILLDPDINSKVTNELSADVEVFEPDFVKDIYLVGWVDGVPIAQFVFEPMNEVSWCGHAQVIPSYRVEYARGFVSQSLDWMWSKGIMKVVIHVPVIFPKTINFAKKCGFEFEGVSKRAHYQNNKLIDLVYMGISNPRAI